MVMPARQGASGQVSVVPSKMAMLVMPPSEMTPPGPDSSASSKPSAAARRR